MLRPRLIDALTRSLDQSRLTLVSAPAGSGKTTLLAELGPAFPQFRFCWLLLEPEDNDPSRFAAGLIASLETAGVLPSEDAPAPNDPRQLIKFAIHRLAEYTGGPCALVVDDLHVITERAVHELLDYLLDHAPRDFRVIMATRHDPAMSLPRRRARGEVGEIRLDDLNFTGDEVSQLAAECLGLNLTADELRMLHARTEGWAAGLRLLATSLGQSPGNRKALLQSGMQGSRRIFEFLAEEVLDRQPDDLRRFLLDTSILARLTPEVCDALTGRDDSVQVLEDLYRRNLYVVAADESESSFRYHDLFADFLRDRLRRERPADWQPLQVRAARAEVSTQNRMRHLLAGKAWEEAAQEIERIGPEYTMRGFVATLRRWIGELPEAVQAQHPRILYFLGQAVWILSEFAEAQPYIEKALDGFRRTNDHEGQAEATVAMANSALMLNELDRCRDLLKEALTFDIPPAGRIQLHTACAWEAIYRKDVPESIRHIDQVFSMMESGEGRTNPLALMTVLYAEGLPGYVPKIEAMCRIMHRQLSGPPDFSHALYHILNSAVLAHRGDVATAETEAQRSMSIAQDCGQVSLIQAALYINFCLVSACHGDWQSIDHWTTLGCDESRHGQIARVWKLHFLYFQARARWHSGNVDGLRATYEAAMAPNPVEAPPVAVYRSLIRGMMRMAERSYAQAEQAFREAVREEEGFPLTRSTCSARLMLAYALLTRGRIEEAMEVFSPYLQESEEDGVPGRLMYENPIVQPLLRQAHERNIQRPFVEKVLALLDAPLNAAKAAGGEALSEREMGVLRVMAEGLGNREIGERLFVSEATVKTHVQRILRKLDAATRTQAVARARELLLI